MSLFKKSIINRRDFSNLIGWIFAARTSSGSESKELDGRDVKNDYINIKDFGVIGDGITDNANSLSRVEHARAFTVAPKGIYKSFSTVPLTYMLANSSAIFKSNQLYAYSINTGANIRGGSYDTSGGVVFNVTAGAVDVIISDVNINNQSALNSTALNFAQSNVKNARIIGNNIRSRGYAVLTNAPADDVDGIIIGLNNLRSDESDAVELNAPGKLHSNIVVVGNTLAAGDVGNNKNSGFALGVARARGVTVVANSIKESRQEAIHFEDEQHTNTVIGNTALNVGGAGFLAGAWSTGLGEGMPVLGNTFRAKAGSTSAGLYMVYDNNGSLPGMVLMGNRAVQFARGIEAGAEDIVAIGNFIESASECAIKMVGGGKLHGENYARNCTTLVKSYKGTVVGKITSSTTPKTILDTSAHKKNALGTVLKGFSFPKSGVRLEEKSRSLVNICTLPLLMYGRIICIVSSVKSLDHIYFSADVKFDGKNFITTNSLSKTFGSLAVGSSNGIELNDSEFSISIFNGGNVAYVNLFFDFDGEYYM